MKQFYVLIIVLTVAAAAPQTEADGILTSPLKFVRDCGELSIVLCAKERALRLVDAVDGDVKITKGITFVESDKNASGGR